MNRNPLHANAARHHRAPQFPGARNMHIHPHAGRRAPRRRRRHQSIAPTVSGYVRAKRVVPLANRMPRVVDRRPTRLSVTR
jgi:hypothetical protein